MEIRSRPVKSCLLCGSAGRLLYERLPDLLFGGPGLWTLKRCETPDCGLIWLDPAPVPEDLPLAYQNYFTHGELDERTSSRSRLRDILYSAYTKVNRTVATLMGVRHAKDQMELMYLNDMTPGKVLDVGCGDGTFLNRMRARGWSVDGVDFDPKAIANARLRYGLDLHHGDLGGIRYPDGTFDAVTLSHVIEHVPDPVGLLREVRRILRPGGRMVLTTPNSESLGHQIYREHWFGLDPPRHLQVFGMSSLKLLVERAGFSVVNQTSTAANADIFIGGSESIRVAAETGETIEQRIHLMRTLRALSGQTREFKLLRKVHSSGEEAVVQAG